MDGLPITTYARVAAAKTSLELFRDLRALLESADGAQATATVMDMDDAEWSAFESAFEALSRVVVLAGMLEKRGVWNDVEQFLNRLYEPTRRPGIAQNYEAPLGGYARTGETL
jgi:hypothetical protein